MKISPLLALALGGAAGVAAFSAVRAVRMREADIAGQLVLITGGSRGLGLALARRFAKLGCRVAICARDAAELARAKAMLAEEGIELFTVICDVSVQSQVHAMVRTVESECGPIDILVNNAGEILVAPLENTSVEDFERAMAVMFWGPLYTTLASLPSMRARGRGRIAVIASIGGKISVPHLLAYSCAKFAAVALFEGMRAELAGSGIHVTTIAPGLMRTGSQVNARFKGKHQDESTWFSAGASLPLISMNAERAAAQSVRAIRCGVAEKILSTQATLVARLQGSFPGLLPEILSLVNRIALPSPTDDLETSRLGLELVEHQGRVMQFITSMARTAGERLNQPSA